MFATTQTRRWSRTGLFVLALLAVALPAALTGATQLSELPEGRFATVAVKASEEGVIVRSEPGFLFKEVGRLERGQIVECDGRKGAWLHLSGKGWSLLDDFLSAEQLTLARNTFALVARDAAA